ncbi:MAG: glutamine--tRNA ligase/YqeY domain fusion protein [Deltaproteobacteria bacterium]|nr:glutamine--tRNA ligase/YqeY domain fusion protein [Deltaproteobacteria bacterium]
MAAPSDFIRNIIKEDVESGKNNGAVITRFPPEPNGYLHMGHAKSICLNFGIAEENRDGICNLRFDDTNPAKENAEYVEAIKSDVKWLGFDLKDRIYYASDYFDKLYECAIKLIKKDKAYVCNLNSEQIREYRGTLTAPGKNSPYRNRSIEENLALFELMKNGEIKEGEAVLRAKIDMNSPNLNMRDPVIYRIKHEPHYRTGKRWHIYPMYDFTHCLSDSFENITHSLCTLEFEDHRPLYDWLLDELKAVRHPKQIEFARLNLTYTVLSKRKLNMLVADNFVSGWDDPRMPTISGIRRRGYTSASIKDFCARIGVAKRDSVVDLALLEHCIREELNNTAKRVMAVINPIKVLIDNYPEEKIEYFDFPYHPIDEAFGFRKVPFSKELYIEREDFMENPPKKFFRLAPGKEVRLRYAYFIKCEDVVYDANGEIKEIHCVYDPKTYGGSALDGRKVKGTIHWVSAKHAISAEVRLYNNLFTTPNPEDKKSITDFRDCINPNSLVIVESAKLEPSLASALPEEKYQFERLGYFCADLADSKEGAPVFNRTAPLKDTWAKIQKQRLNS